MTPVTMRPVRLMYMPVDELEGVEGAGVEVVDEVAVVGVAAREGLVVAEVVGITVAVVTVDTRSAALPNQNSGEIPYPPS